MNSDLRIVWKRSENNMKTGKDQESQYSTSEEKKSINKKQNKCNICDYSFTNLKNHVKSVHERKKTNKCSICDHSFANKSNLKKHVESVHKEKKKQVLNL